MPLSFLLLPPLAANTPFFLALTYFPPIFALFLTFISYRVILRGFRLASPLPAGSLLFLLVPVLLVLLVEHHVFNRVYGSTIVVDQSKIIYPVADHWEMLLLQLLAFASLFCVLYACKKLSERFDSQMRLAALAQQTQAQELYLREARSRYEQTRAFRHDVKGHILALQSLLREGELDRAVSYLGQLEQVSGLNGPSYHTGSAVVDALLSCKLEQAALRPGLELTCRVSLPSPCPFADLDLCILFSNALDNAVKACGSPQGQRPFLRVSSRLQGDFWLLELENSLDPAQPYPKGAGLGLDNIRAMATRYQGAVTAGERGQSFLLHVLLVIPRRLDDSSGQAH